MGGIVQFGGKAGVKAATQPEVEFAATNGTDAITSKAVVPKGLYWWWEKLRTLPLNFTDIVTFSKAFVITALAGQGEKIVIVDNTGKIIAAYITAEEFVAVPPTLSSSGTPGQKAYLAPFLYYCVAVNTWVIFPAQGSEFGILEIYVAVPPTTTSPGSQGQRAFDSTNMRMYECIADNIWIYWDVFNS